MTDAPERIWVDDERPQGGEVHVWDDLPELAKQYAVEYIRADLVPAPSVTGKAAAQHLLTIWDHWMASDDAGPDAAFLMLQSACFAAQAYEDAAQSDMTANSAPGQMLRTLLVALIDLSSPELDHLRACNRPSPKRAE